MSTTGNAHIVIAIAVKVKGCEATAERLQNRKIPRLLSVAVLKKDATAVGAILEIPCPLCSARARITAGSVRDFSAGSGSRTGCIRSNWLWRF
jgi:hypothetical protein